MSTTTELQAPPADERRSFPRYAPDPLVPVLFAHPDAETPSAGHIADISVTGVRIVAPPMARPFLHWPDPLRIEVSYSDSTRAAGIEGLKLKAYVVRLQVDGSGFVVHAAFERSGSDGDWDRLSAWVGQLAGSAR